MLAVEGTVPGLDHGRVRRAHSTNLTHSLLPDHYTNVYKNIQLTGDGTVEGEESDTPAEQRLLQEVSGGTILQEQRLK